MAYEPTWESLRQHAVPAWFHDAKLGIFVHWGPYSVPGWAPTTGDLHEVIAREGWPGWFKRNPYAEWYLHSLRVEGSPTQRYHLETYGPGFAYDDFAPMFNQAIRQWDAGEWAATFKRVGARYVVLTSRHCDSFALWPTEHPCPKKKDYRASRDIVGELTRAVRSQGMRMGLYYCSGMDWTFSQEVIRDAPDIFLLMPQEPAYVAYVDAHWRELIDRYEPSIMWGDIGYPAAGNLRALFASYYNRVPDGVVNDRFVQFPVPANRALRAVLRAAVRLLLPLLIRRGGGSACNPSERVRRLPGGAHYDFRTPEYTSYDQIVETKWESTRGIGHSFGYNRNEGPEDYISVEKLVRTFVDIVSKGGNLLLNVGPMADGTIPALQRERLEGLGAWLDVNGEAIFHTRPWVAAEGEASAQDVSRQGAPLAIPVRFTQKGGALYAVLMGTPRGARVTIQGLRAAEGTQVHLIGREGTLSWQQEDGGLAVALPGSIADSWRSGSPAHVLRITPPPALTNA